MMGGFTLHFWKPLWVAHFQVNNPNQGCPIKKKLAKFNSGCQASYEVPRTQVFKFSKKKTRKYKNGILRLKLAIILYVF
jgi:hypothetical protein